MSRNNKSRFWFVVWILSPLLIFEAAIRSLSRNDLLPQTGILPGLWFSDLGIILPILAYIRLKGFRFLKSKVIFALALVTGYGLCVAIINNNHAPSIVADIRIITCFLSGYCLIYIVPGRSVIIMRSLMVLSCIVFSLSIYSIMMSERFQFNIQSVRITSVAAFILLGLAITLISPVLAWIVCHRKGFVEYSYLLLFIVFFAFSVLIMQTRSLAGTLLLAVSLSIISATWLRRMNVLAFDFNKYSMKIGYSVVAIGAIFILFTEIHQIGAFYTNITADREYNWTERMNEVEVSYRSLSTLDILTGKGLGPVAVYYNKRDEEVGTFHIGIFNIFYRFGVLVFAAMLYFLIKMILQWLYIVLLIRSRKGYGTSQKAAIILCGPGLFTVVFISFISGGWSQSSLLSLGMLYGFYTVISRELNEAIL